MSNGYLLHSLLLGPAGLNAQVAALQFGRSRDLFEIHTALELISTSAEDDLAGSLRDRFDAHRTALNQSATYGGAIRIVEDDVMPLLRAIPDTSWERIARRFGTAREASRILRSPGLNAWMPEVQVEGEDPAQVRLFEYLTSSMIRNLLGVSAVENKKNSDWRSGLFESGLLEARSVRVRVSPLPDGSEFGLQAQWGLAEGSPSVKIWHRRDCRSPVSELAYVILRSCRTSGHPRVSLKANEMTRVDDERFRRHSGAIKLAVSNFWKLMWPTESSAYVEKLVEIQEDLLTGAGQEKLRKALEGLGLPKKMRNYLSTQAARLSIRVGVDPMPEASASYAAFSWRPEEKMTALGNWKGKDTLFVTLGLTYRYLTLVSQEELWATVARALAAWVAEGEPRKETRIPFPVEDPNRGNAGRSVVFQPGMVPLSPLPEVSNERVEEYRDLFHWLPGVSRRNFFSGFPGLEEIGAILSDSDLGELRHFKFPLSKLRWIDQPEQEEATLSLEREPPIAWEATIRGDLRQMQGVEPLELLERISWWAQRLESTLKTQRKYKPVSLFVPLRGMPESGDLWAWLRLFRRYEKLDPVSAPPGFQILGGSAKALAPEIAPVLQKYHLTDPLKVQGAFSRHTVWVTDNSQSGVPSRSIANQTIPKVATRASILAAPRAKLLHFNGRPQFDRETWELLVRVALDAPSGLTWFDPHMPWNTNRPALTVEAGDEGWYALNEHYAPSSAQERAAYRWALSYVRARLKESSLASLEPKSTKGLLRNFYRALMSIHHPDRRGTTQDVGGVFRNLTTAFEILDKFYR